MRDLLNGFGGRGSYEDSGEEEEEEDSGEIELSLGLSLGGCFGVDPKKKGLLRSSSVASMPAGGGVDGEEVEAEKGVLVRTCSLPVQTEEEQRKRKSMQTMRRMEVKRRRMEKRGEKWSSWEGRGKEEEEEEEEEERGKVEMGSEGVGVEDNGVVSQRSCAGGLDGGGIMQGLKDGTMMQTIPRHAVNNAIPPIPTAAKGMPKKVEERSNGLMEQMPCVLARGEGPNGRVVEGFLYKYKKGEEVKIVCVCHGRFLTPAEFVKHAGGGDVPYPLKHIVVKPPSMPFS